VVRNHLGANIDRLQGSSNLFAIHFLASEAKSPLQMQWSGRSRLCEACHNFRCQRKPGRACLYLFAFCLGIIAISDDLKN